jgi:acyl carrier protein
MQPSAYVLLERLPLTVNGKLDPQALPEPEWRVPDYAAPVTDTEARLAEIWQEILGQEQVSVTAGFFDLGGHSLLATRLINAVQRRMQVELPIRLIFERSDIRNIAAIIDEQQLRQRNLQMAMEKAAHVEMEW